MALAVLIAFATTLLLTPYFAKAAWRAGAVSHPDGARRLQPKSTPLWGGAAVLVGLYLGISVAWGLGLVAGETGRATSALMLSAGMICLLGCYDDLRAMSAHGKLAGQIVAVLPVVLGGLEVQRLLVFGFEIELGWLAGPLIIAWLLLGINAMNLLDGMDGLASLTGILVSLGVAAIGFGLGMGTLVTPALLLPAALLGFLFHNRPPAKIYLGDAGSMLIGLLVAAMAIQPLADRTVAINATVAGLLLLLPLADTTLAILRRTLRGKSLLEGDRGHIHHCLLQRGLSPWKVLGVLGCLGLVNGCLAWFAAVSGHGWAAWTIVAVGLPLLVHSRFLGHQEWALFVNKVSRVVGWPSATEGAVAGADEAATGGSAPGRDERPSPVPQPHFRQLLQPSSRPHMPLLNTSESGRGPGHRGDVARANPTADPAHRSR